MPYRLLPYRLLDGAWFRDGASVGDGASVRDGEGGR